MAKIITPDQFQAPQPNLQMAADIQRIAIGLDMLVGLFSEKFEMELTEVKDEQGNTVLRWRPRGAEETQGKSEKSTDSKA